MIEFSFGGARVGGRFLFEATNYWGRQRVLADWFDNLVLDQGLNRMGSGSFFNFCQVGSSSVAPSVTDTGLLGFVAATNTQNAISQGAQSVAPYYGYVRRTFRFSPGATAANLAEVAVGWAATSGPNLFSRSLIKDSGGVETVVTPLIDETLDVTYELRLYPPLLDSAPVVINLRGTDHTMVARAARVTDTQLWVPQDGNVRLVNWGGTPAIQAYGGGIGSITSSPSGVSRSSSNRAEQPYSNNSLVRDVTAVWELNDGVLSEGISSFYITTSLGAYQVSVTPPIMKTLFDKLTMNFRISWGRYVA